jgi:hypothetical protein
MSKQLAMAMAVGGAVLLVFSMMSLNYADASQWFPVLLIGGGVLVLLGIQKYRAAY